MADRSDTAVRYVLATGEAGARRLRLLHEVHGPTTEHLLTELLARPGMAVADIGCGIGVVACWLAGRVGPGGRVVGVDLSAPQLAVARAEAAARGLGQVRFVEASVYDTGLAREAFDLVCCRSLLSHLSEPSRALREMSALVKPGGILLAEDIDMTTVFTEPPSAVYERVTEIFLTLGAARGFDCRIGSRLPALFREAGYPDPEVRSDQFVATTGETKRYWEYTFIEVAPAMLEAGVTTAAEVAAIAEGLARLGADGATTIAQPRKTQVWARKTG